MGGCAGSLFVGLARSRGGYLHKAALQQDLSAVTAACFMVKKEAFEKVGGFEEKLAVAFNDVDFCLKVRHAGYLVVYDLMRSFTTTSPRPEAMRIRKPRSAVSRRKSSICAATGCRIF